MNLKNYVCSDLKFDEKNPGTFEAKFATLNTWDKDTDYTFPGAFGTQKVFVGVWNHGIWEKGSQFLPLGVGVISERGDDAVINGEFDLADPDAVKTYKKFKYLMEKGMPPEFSYALPEIVSEVVTINGITGRGLKKIKVNEVSPVLMGAGVNTELLDVKSILKKAIPSHSTSTNTESWDAGAMVRRARSGETSQYYARIFAWKDSEADQSVKSSYKFPHHFVHSDGEPGAASTRAAIAGIAVLNGGRGGANIPDADRQGVYKHLAQHLTDANIEPPELKAIDYHEEKKPILDAIGELIVDAEGIIDRVKEIEQLRGEDGRKPSIETMNRVKTLREIITDLVGRLNQGDNCNDNAKREFLLFQNIVARR